VRVRAGKGRNGRHSSFPTTGAMFNFTVAPCFGSIFAQDFGLHPRGLPSWDPTCGDVTDGEHHHDSRQVNQAFKRRRLQLLAPAVNRLSNEHPSPSLSFMRAPDGILQLQHVSVRCRVPVSPLCVQQAIFFFPRREGQRIERASLLFSRSSRGRTNAGPSCLSWRIAQWLARKKRTGKGEKENRTHRLCLALRRRPFAPHTNNGFHLGPCVSCQYRQVSRQSRSMLAISLVGRSSRPSNQVLLVPEMALNMGP